MNSRKAKKPQWADSGYVPVCPLTPPAMSPCDCAGSYTGAALICAKHQRMIELFPELVEALRMNQMVLRALEPEAGIMLVRQMKHNEALLSKCDSAEEK